MKRSGGWNQEVTDDQGRRRFHGAFTGGFSAGYYNSVGSAEGWTPATFSSSRGSRASVAQRPEDFMDEDDDPLLGKRLETAEAYDTLQVGARQKLQSAISSGEAKRHEMAVFHVPDEIMQPMNEYSIGKKLLSQMGWKDGHGIGPRMRRRKLSIGSDDANDGESKPLAEEEAVYLAPRNTVDARVFPKPKIDKYGAGFDPYVDAPEFMKHKMRQNTDKSQPPQRQIVTFAEALGGGSSTSSSRAAMAFGLSALEDNDDLDVYGTTSMDDFDRAIAPSGESTKLIDLMSSREREEKRQRNAELSSGVLCADERPALPGFHIARLREKPATQVIQRLKVPSDFRAYHSFEKEDDGHSVRTVYSKFNFTTEKGGRGSIMTAQQRARILQDSDETSLSRDEKAHGSVFDLLDPSQRDKLSQAAHAARAERKPLIQGPSSDQFRANITASIAKRFVSASFTEANDSKAEDRQTSISLVKKSNRSEDAWAPQALLCKRFRVKCKGRTISGGDDDEKPQDLFSTELAPHLVDLAATRSRQEKATATPATKKDRAQEEPDLPSLPVITKPSNDLLRSIFEPSDASEVEEDSDSNSDDNDSHAAEGVAPSADDAASRLNSDFGNSESRANGAKTFQLAERSDSSSSESSDEEDHVKSMRQDSSRNKRRSRSESEERNRKKHKKSKHKKEKKSKKHKKHMKTSRSDRDEDDAIRSSRRERHRRNRSRSRSHSRPERRR